MGSALFEEKRSSKDAVVAWLLHIHFDAFQSVPAKDFYYSSTVNIEFPVDGVLKEFVQGYMVQIPRGRHQKDRDNDYCEFSLVNAGNALYQEFLPYENIIEKGEVTIYHCLEISKDFYEGEVRFFGYLKDFTLADADKTLKFTAFSDMSRKGFPVGATVLTRERCRADFNVNGAFPPDAYRLCTWQTIQGGNPTYCSKYRKGVDSCEAHGNLHQFAAIDKLSSADIEFVPSGNIDFPYNNNPCFTAKTFIVDQNWQNYSIAGAKEGDIIKAFDLYTGEIVDTEILEVQIHEVEEYIIAHFMEGGDIETTPEHLFKVEGSTFAPIAALVGREVSGRDLRRNKARDRLTAIYGVHKPTTVYNLRTASHTYYVTNGNFYYEPHNNKQHLPMFG